MKQYSLVSNGVTKAAVFSHDRKYRYNLSRIWQPLKGYVCFVGLNPSTADENVDDPTIRRCINFSKAWGYGGLIMVNLFAFRATDPKQLFLEPKPIGYENNRFIFQASAGAKETLAAWGIHGNHLNRCQDVVELLKNPHILGLTKNGSPRHPLYLKKDLFPVPWLPAMAREYDAC